MKRRSIACTFFSLIKDITSFGFIPPPSRLVVLDGA
jgi:hypothetical protein